eukprot:4155030-Amphidinium_carterae.1
MSSLSTSSSTRTLSRQFIELQPEKERLNDTLSVHNMWLETTHCVATWARTLALASYENCARQNNMFMHVQLVQHGVNPVQHGSRAFVLTTTLNISWVTVRMLSYGLYWTSSMLGNLVAHSRWSGTSSSA